MKQWHFQIKEKGCQDHGSQTDYIEGNPVISPACCIEDFQALAQEKRNEAKSSELSDFKKKLRVWGYK